MEALDFSYTDYGFAASRDSSLDEQHLPVLRPLSDDAKGAADFTWSNEDSRLS